MSGPGPQRQFEQFLKDRNPHLQYCLACDVYSILPRALCTRCGSHQKLEWRPIRGGGRVYAATTIRRPAEKGGDYNISIVELDEGPRLMTTIVDIGPQEISIGLPVSIAGTELNGLPALVFRPAAAAG